MNLDEKIRASIDFIQEYAPQADKYGGYSVMFSGGKDSQVMLDLFKKSGVNYRAFYCVTTNDPPENVYFIRKHYPDVVFLHPRLTFLELIEKNGILPTMTCRFCCKELKESKGKGFVAVGVRREESPKRQKYNPITFVGGKLYDQKKMRKNRKVSFMPILEWREDEVWQYIEDNDIPVNPCYDTRGRVGCMLCPFASAKEIFGYFHQYPKMLKNLKRIIERCMDRGRFRDFKDSDEVVDWWLSKLSYKDYRAKQRQLKLFE